MTEWCYVGEPSEDGAPEGGCSGLGGRSSRTKTGFMVMVRHFVGAGRLSLVGMMDLTSKKAAAVPAMKKSSTDETPGMTSEINTSTAHVDERSTSPKAKWITTSCVADRREEGGAVISSRDFESWSAARARVCVARLG